VATLLLSVDFEDWHQLVRRRLGAPGWQEPGPALARQSEALLGLLDELGVRATFFILGIAARAHPELVRAVADAGHEIACHGDQHRLVHTQTPDEFAADVRAAHATIEELTGVAPAGYRAPAFSITREAAWAYDVLAAQGFAYDSSQHDSPRIRGRSTPVSAAPHQMALGDGRTLWELPPAVWRVGRRGRLPVGGASYWAVMPTGVVLRGLSHAGDMAGLYLHPHELDPQPLRVHAPTAGTDSSVDDAPALGPRPTGGASQRARAALREAQRNLARRRAPGVLRAIAGRHRLITYGEAHAELSRGASPRS
jgi:polysaccharide deacetylase family protein (PEP-CTERM system associated)